MNKKILFPIVASFVLVILACLAVFVINAENKGELKSPPIQTDPSIEVIKEATTYDPETTTQKIRIDKDNLSKINLNEYFEAKTVGKVFNNELQFYIDSQTEFRNNKIILTAEKLPNKYISGKAESKKAFKYGEFHFRINTLKGRGLFPAIWMMPSTGELFPEIDIFEMVGSHPYRVSGVLHYLDNGAQKKHFYDYNFPMDNVPESYDIKFIWKKDLMVWTVNGKELLRNNKDVPDMPMYMIFNLAVGGNWPGDPDKDTPFPSSLTVEIIEFKPSQIFSR